MGDRRLVVITTALEDAISSCAQCNHPISSRNPPAGILLAIRRFEQAARKVLDITEVDPLLHIGVRERAWKMLQLVVTARDMFLLPPI